MTPLSPQAIAMHEVGHVVARLRLEQSDRSLLAPEPFTFVSVEANEFSLGRAHMPPRLFFLSCFDSPDGIRRYRARRRRLASTREKQRELDRDVEADIIEMLAGPIAEDRARLGRPPSRREIADLADYMTSNTWVDDIALGGAADSDFHKAQRWMCWLTDRRRVDATSIARRLAHQTIQLIGSDSVRGFRKLNAMAAMLVERRSMDADAFTTAWARISGGRA